MNLYFLSQEEKEHFLLFIDFLTSSGSDLKSISKILQRFHMAYEDSMYGLNLADKVQEVVEKFKNQIRQWFVLED